MPQPSPLAIASSSLQRLVKEEASYHAEAEMQQKSIDRHKKSQSQMTSQGEGAEEEEDEDEDERGNRAFLLKQEVRPSLFLFEFLTMAFASCRSPCFSRGSGEEKKDCSVAHMLTRMVFLVA